MTDPNKIAEKGKTVATRWGTQDGMRQVSLDRARAVSALTIPQIMPAQGHNEHSELLTPFNDMGARVVNNLSNKLEFTLSVPGYARLKSKSFKIHFHFLPPALYQVVLLCNQS